MGRTAGRSRVGSNYEAIIANAQARLDRLGGGEQPQANEDKEKGGDAREDHSLLSSGMQGWGRWGCWRGNELF